MDCKGPSRHQHVDYVEVKISPDSHGAASNDQLMIELDEKKRTVGAPGSVNECNTCSEEKELEVFAECGHRVSCRECGEEIILRYPSNGCTECRQTYCTVTAAYLMKKLKEVFPPEFPTTVEPDKKVLKQLRSKVQDMLEKKMGKHMMVRELKQLAQKIAPVQFDACMWILSFGNVQLQDVALEIERATKRFGLAAKRALLKVFYDPKIDPSMYALRAAAGTVGTTVISHGGLTSSIIGSLRINAVSGGIVAGLFIAYDIYRCCRGKEADMTWVKVLVNAGEHVLGVAAGGVGATVGATVGAGFGTLVCPVIGTYVGAILGGLLIGFLSDFFARSFYRNLVNCINKGKLKEASNLLLKDAASKIGVNLDVHSYDEARTRFRNLILDAHPDKELDEEKKVAKKEKAQEILAVWQIVRKHYLQRMSEEEKRDELSLATKWYVVLQQVKKGVWKRWRMFWSEKDAEESIKSIELGKTKIVAENIYL